MAILIGYDGGESEVVDPRKKSQLTFVVVTKGGAMLQRIVAKLREKLFGYNGNESEVFDPHKKSQLIFV